VFADEHLETRRASGRPETKVTVEFAGPMREVNVKALGLFVVLLLVLPMLVLNPLGRPAFLGYYLGVIATWAAVVVAYRFGSTEFKAAR
jgi:hypothetical protein